MGSDTQSNEEQLEMLLMTLAEVRHGICLFQSESYIICSCSGCVLEMRKQSKS